MARTSAQIVTSNLIKIVMWSETSNSQAEVYQLGCSTKKADSDGHDFRIQLATTWEEIWCRLASNFGAISSFCVVEHRIMPHNLWATRGESSKVKGIAIMISYESLFMIRDRPRFTFVFMSQGRKTLRMSHLNIYTKQLCKSANLRSSTFTELHPVSIFLPSWVQAYREWQQFTIS